MLLDNPPPPEPVKRSEALFIAEHLEQQPGGWAREVTFFFEGEEYRYGIQARYATTESEARKILYGKKPDAEVRDMFLKEVALDMTRKH